MYVLTVESSKQAKQVQLRDNQMRLIAFFHPARLKQILEQEHLMEWHDEILQVIEKAKPGILYQINTEKKQ